MFCCLINKIAKIETGYAFQAKDRSERMHRLPYPPHAMGEKSYPRVHEGIMKFIRDDIDAQKYAIDHGKPMVFTYSEFYSSEDVQVDVLNSFMKQFSFDGSVDIDIYPLNHLYYVLRNQLVEKKRLDRIPNENFVKVLLERDPYESQGNISCNVCNINHIFTSIHENSFNNILITFVLFLFRSFTKRRMLHNTVH